MCNRNYLKSERNLSEAHQEFTKIDGEIGDSGTRAPWIIILGGLHQAPNFPSSLAILLKI